MAWSRSFGQTSQGLWFHLLCLDHERTKKQVGLQELKVYFLGVLKYLKGLYRLHDEVNNKFILSRDVISLNFLKMIRLLSNNLIMWINLPIEKHILNVRMRFHILKGGTLSWINLWNLLLKHRLPLTNKFLPLHQKIRVGWMM